eukprot:15437093-Alexandrium_andersonii.AAC.1
MVHGRGEASARKRACCSFVCMACTRVWMALCCVPCCMLHAVSCCVVCCVAVSLSATSAPTVSSFSRDGQPILRTV